MTASSLHKRQSLPLDPEKILKLLDRDGPLSLKLKSFEVRPEQQMMLRKLLEAFNSNAIVLIEAGTGTGKSIAYLIPALLAALIWKEKVVISTHTISLQEQLLYKDLPVLMEALGIELKAILVKGMGNYMCLRKWDEIAFERTLLSESEKSLLDQMEAVSLEKGKGSRSDLPFNPPQKLWEMIYAEYDTCNGPDCHHYQRCPYIQARKNAQDAQLLIVNHHLLLTDLILRSEGQNYNSSALLPLYHRIVIDEAHNLEDIATEYFAKRISRLDLFKTVAKISSEKQGKTTGKLPIIKEKFQKHLTDDFSRNTSQFLNYLTLDLPALKRDLLKELSDTFQTFEKFQILYGKSIEGDENKLRLRVHHYEELHWKKEVIPQAEKLSLALKRYGGELCRLDSYFKDFDTPLNESVKGVLFDIKTLAKRLETEAINLETFVLKAPSAESIRWLEFSLTRHGSNVACIDAALNISDLLLKYLFNPFPTVALLSATLTTQNSFEFFRKRLGLTEENLNQRPLIQARFDSPFNYEKQALFVVPEDISSPSAPEFMKEAIELIFDAVQASQGNAFVLFTSYGMLKTCYQALEERLREAKFHLLKQGDDNRQTLIKKFIENNRSILFGTDSFWEGIDVVGEALRLVIIAKLPFKVPSDPLIEARSEFLLTQGKDPFYELLLPQAAIKLKQGFGRLIRNKRDRGCIVCLDNRIIKKSYGQFFLKSLPECPQAIVNKAIFKSTLFDFYRRTHYLTKATQ